MTIATAPRNLTVNLPPALSTAQAAVHRPEVQEMMRRLSHYGLGIFMPHMHDERTGEFQPLPDDVVQVESGLEVSFQQAGHLASQCAERFVPVGWYWRAGGSTASAVCEMDEDDEPGSTDRYGKHKMMEGR